MLTAVARDQSTRPNRSIHSLYKFLNSQFQTDRVREHSHMEVPLQDIPSPSNPSLQVQL